MSAVVEPLASSTQDEKHFEGARLVQTKPELEPAVETDHAVADAPAASPPPPADPIDDLPMHQVIRLLRSSVPGHAANNSTRSSAARRVQRTMGNRASRQIVMRARVVQRQCACGGTCAKCQEEEQQRQIQREVQTPVQRSSAAYAPTEFDGIPASTGEQLDTATRRPMEAHFGTDLADVRVHTGSEAAKSATSLDALAYTSGRDIYFAAGMYAPSSDSGRRLVAHEVAHVVQQGSGKEPTVATKSSHGAKIGAPDDPLETEADRAAEEFMTGSLTDEEQRKKRESSSPVQRFIQRQEDAGAPPPAPVANQQQPMPATVTPGPNGPAPATPSNQVGAATSIVYDGRPLSPVNVGTTLSLDAAELHGLMKRMIADHGALETKAWVDNLNSWIQKEENYLHAEAEKENNSKGDVSGAPLPDTPERKRLLPIKKDVVNVFVQEWAVWDKRISEIHNQFDEQLLSSISELLAKSETQILAEASRYGISLDVPTGPSLADLGIKIPALPAEGQKSGLKVAARQLLELWRKRNQAKVTAQALLTPPWDLINIDREYAIQRRNLTMQYPVLAAYSTSQEKLAELAGDADADPTRSLKSEMNKRLDNIAWVRAGMRSHLLPMMKQDKGLRDSTKSALHFESHSVEERVVEDDAAGASAEQKELERFKSVITVGLLIISFVPGLQAVGIVGGLALAGADIYSKFEEYSWEEAASGTAFDRAFAISQSDPSLFRLGLEIAAGIAAGVVEGAVIAEAVRAFKFLGPLIHEAVAARFAGALAADTATAEASTMAMTRLREQAGPGLGDRLQASIEHGDFGDVGAGKIVKGADAAVGFHQEIADIPDAFGGSPHEIGIGDRGLERCSLHCILFSESLASRAENVQRSVGASAETLEAASALRQRAASIGVRAHAVEVLPEPRRATGEAKLLKEARAVELEMTALEHQVLGFSSARPLPDGGTWSGVEGNSRWTPPKGSRAYEYTKGRPIEFHNNFPNFTEYALPGGDINLPNMKGTSVDFTAADRLAAQKTGMASAAEFRAWRTEAGFTWHHRENSMTMQLVPTPLHASVPHLGGAWVSRGYTTSY